MMGSLDTTGSTGHDYDCRSVWQNGRATAPPPKELVCIKFRRYCRRCPLHALEVSSTVHKICCRLNSQDLVQHSARQLLTHMNSGRPSLGSIAVAARTLSRSKTFVRRLETWLVRAAAAGDFAAGGGPGTDGRGIVWQRQLPKLEASSGLVSRMKHSR